MAKMAFEFYALKVLELNDRLDNLALEMYDFIEDSYGGDEKYIRKLINMVFENSNVLKEKVKYLLEEYSK